MNEKEIIKDLKNFIALAQKEENFIYYSEYKFDNELAERVQELLNLYNKEKEKNNSISIQYEKVVDKLEALEQIEQEHKEENGRLRDRIKELEKVILLDSKPIILGMIPISRIKEKIEELTKIKGDLATYIATSERIKVLQELLEESEK